MRRMYVWNEGGSGAPEKCAMRKSKSINALCITSGHALCTRARKMAGIEGTEGSMVGGSCWRDRESENERERERERNEERVEEGSTRQRQT